MHILLYSSVVLTASAAVLRTPVARQLDPCQETADDMSDDPGRSNTDGTAGIGAEFESVQFNFKSKNCAAATPPTLKGKTVLQVLRDNDGNIIGDQPKTGTNWKLTADTLQQQGRLNAEYILDGTQIKVGSQNDATNAAAVAAAFSQDLVSWNPWATDDNRLVHIQDDTCGDWMIDTKTGLDMGRMEFQPQITAPMPLEALYTLLKENADNPQDNPPDPNRNILNGVSYSNLQGLKLVTQDSFQSNPSGIDKTKVTDDVLAFCTLILSYAKGAKSVNTPGSSPKKLTSFMPRTNFNVIFAQVSSKLPAKGGDLWALFNSLVCYKYTNGGVDIDTDFCTGDPSNPSPIGTEFGDTNFVEGDATCNVKDWISGLDPDSQDDDALTVFDRAIDGSVGGLGSTQEKVFNTQRSVPLFEFRDLNGVFPATPVYPGQMTVTQFMGAVDQAIQDLHSKFANPPSRKIRRQSDSCPTSDPDPAPVQADPPVCAGVGTIKWMGRDALNGVIPQFCDTAEQQGVQDSNSGSIQRNYLDGSVDKVSLSIDWPSGGDFKPNKADCITYLTTIMDGCDGNDPVHNPLNWKHGGSLQAGIAKFNVNPLNDRYTSGTCSFHVHETEYVDGFDTPGFEAITTFFIGADIKDGNGNIIGGTNGQDAQAGQDAANPYIYNGLYNSLSMLPESQGGDYIQFNIGTQSWTSSQTDQSQFPRCSTGDWDTSWSTYQFTGGPRGRDMDCSFSC